MTDEKRVYYASLRRRALALVRVLTISVEPIPPVIVALHVKNLMAAAIGYCGAEIREMWLGWFDERLRLDAGLCRFCGRIRNGDTELCEVCVKENEEIDLEAEEPHGGVM
jgi:hypothetical protein